MKHITEKFPLIASVLGASCYSLYVTTVVNFRSLARAAYAARAFFMSR
jgi:hypothetical protein